MDVVLRRLKSFMAVAIAGAMILAHLGGCGFGGGPDEPAEAFDSPPAWPGYEWQLDGSKVGWQVIATAAGPSHCDVQSATFMTIGWPPGTYASTSAHARQYIRDAKHVVRFGSLRTALELHSRVPAGARTTGLTYGHLEVYVASDLDQAIYVVGKTTTERWPRSEPMTVCI